MASLTPLLKCEAKLEVTKQRILPLKGEVLVAIGDKVEPGSLVAQAEMPGEVAVLRLPEVLGLDPHEVLENLLIKEGDLVNREQLLINFKTFFGIFRTTFNSPVAGTVEFISSTTAHVGIRLEPRIIKLQAYISGKVTAVIPQQACTISTSAALIQGIFGIGGERYGKIKLLPREEILTANLVPTDCKDLILVGGHTPEYPAIKKAVDGGAKGIICGSFSGSILQEYLGYEIGVAITGNENVPLTLIATEGFGHLSISKRSYDLLSKFDGACASINGATQVRAGALRPEIIIPHDQNLESTLNSQILEVDRKVRIIRYPYFGVIGDVVELPEELQVLETGTFCRTVKIKLSDQRVVVVPRANVEIIS